MDRRTFLKWSMGWAAGLAAVRIGAQSPGTFPIPILELSGAPRERGRVHGEDLRSKIVEHVRIWKDLLGRQHRIDPDDYLAEFLARTRFEPAIERWTPGLLDEVRGMAEGAGLDYPTMLAFQLVDEEWWFGRHRRWKVPIPEAKHCSALGVWGQEGRPNLAAQNLDIPAFSDGFQVLLRIRHPDSDLESLVFSYAGLVALCGLNNRGVGEVVNALLQLDHRVDGLPVAFVNRGILARESQAAAAAFVRGLPHASGQAYTIVGPEGGACFECSANRVVPYLPAAGLPRVWHTNHPLANDDRGIEKLFQEKQPERRASGPGNSEVCFAALEKRLHDPERSITVADVREALSSRDDPGHPVCRRRRPDGLGGFTAGSIIMECGPRPRMHLAPGPPCDVAFRAYDFT